jgi:hypothetical protein
MNTRDLSPNSQPIDPPVGRLIETRLAMAGASGTLDDALDALADGRPILAKHTIESALDTLDEARRRELQTVDALARLPPVFKIDAALHENRVAFLEKYAAINGWRFKWVEGNFLAKTDDGFALHVYATDAWRCSHGMPGDPLAGVGLTALSAHLLGQYLDVAVANLAKWYENMKGAAR